MVIFFMQESHTCVLIFGIDTFGIKHHKINSEEFNFSGKTLVRPYGDYLFNLYWTASKTLMRQKLHKCSKILYRPNLTHSSEDRS